MLKKDASFDLLLFLGPVSEVSSAEALSSTVCWFYCRLEDALRALNAIIDDMRRAWSARIDDGTELVDAGAAIDPGFIHEQVVGAFRLFGRTNSTFTISRCLLEVAHRIGFTAIRPAKRK